MNDTESLFEEPKTQIPKFNPYDLNVHSDEELKQLRESKRGSDNKTKKAIDKKIRAFRKWNNFIFEIIKYDNYKSKFAYNEAGDDRRGVIIYKGDVLFYVNDPDGKFYKYNKPGQFNEPEKYKYDIVSTVIEKYEKDIHVEHERKRLKDTISQRSSVKSNEMPFGRYGPPSSKYNNPQTVEYVVNNDIEYMIFMREKHKKLEVRTTFDKLIRDNNLEDLYQREKKDFDLYGPKQLQHNHQKSAMPTVNSDMAKKLQKLNEEILMEKKLREEKQVNIIDTDTTGKITFPYRIYDGTGNHVSISYIKSLETKKRFKIQQTMTDNSDGKKYNLYITELTHDGIIKRANELLLTHKAIYYSRYHINDNNKPVSVDIHDKKQENLVTKTEEKSKEEITIPYIVTNGENNRIVITQDSRKNYRFSQLMVSNIDGSLVPFTISRVSFDDVREKAKEILCTHKSIRKGNPVRRGKTNKKEIITKKNNQLQLPLTENNNNNVTITISIPQKSVEITKSEEKLPVSEQLVKVTIDNEEPPTSTAASIVEDQQKTEEPTIQVNETQPPVPVVGTTIATESCKLDYVNVDEVVETPQPVAVVVETKRKPTVFDKMATIANKVLFFVNGN